MDYLDTYIRWKLTTFNGKCRQIFHRWSIWVSFQAKYIVRYTRSGYLALYNFKFFHFDLEFSKKEQSRTWNTFVKRNILRETQHTPGAYPRHPLSPPKWKEFRNINCWARGWKGYAKQGSVGKVLETCEQWKKPWLVGLYRGWQTTQLYRALFHKPWNKDPY